MHAELRSFAAVSPLAMTGAASGEATLRRCAAAAGQPADVIEMHGLWSSTTSEAEAERADVGRNQVGPPAVPPSIDGMPASPATRRRDAAGPDVPVVAVDAIGRPGLSQSSQSLQAFSHASPPGSITGGRTGTVRQDGKKADQKQKSVTLQNDFLQL